MPARDKTQGLPIPSPVNPGSTICVTFTIPNASEYRQALRGVIADLGKWWNWAHTVGESTQPAQDAAELWRLAATTMTYSEECPDPMSCADVAECIENDASTRASVQQIVSQQANPGTTAVPGQRLPDSKWAANLTPTDDCSFDAFWAQCSQFVDYLVTAGNDFLEQLEVYSNSVEAAQFIEMIPAIGTIIDEAQIDKMIQFVDWIAESMSEWYVGADTQPNREAIACALFCAMRHDCALSIEGAFDVINERCGGVFTPSSLDSMDDLLDAALAIVTNPALPLDVWVAFVLAFARVAGYLGVQGIDASLNIVLKIAVNDANNDWETLCVDCPPDPEECAGASFSYDFRISEQGFVSTPVGINYANYHAGSGWGPNDGLFRISIDKAIAGTINKVRVYYNTDAIPGLNLRATWANGWGPASYAAQTSGWEGDEWYIERTGMSLVGGISIETTTGDTFPPETRMTRACVWLD